MTAKEIIELSAEFLGLDELLATNVFVTTGTAPTSEQLKEVNTLIRCLNLVLDEIATEFFPITKNKNIQFVNGEKLINEIDVNMLEIISLQNNDGTKIRFRADADKIYANTETANVNYRSRPISILELTNNCDQFGLKLTKRIFAYGVAMEFSFINSLTDDATIWENRFKNSLLTQVRKNSEKQLPQRRWL
ncbi:MAG: hypothetical protein RR140_03640 [Clostridia bacterium]